jgi:hypothetical protein
VRLILPPLQLIAGTAPATQIERRHHEKISRDELMPAVPLSKTNSRPILQCLINISTAPVVTSS